MSLQFQNFILYESYVLSAKSSVLTLFVSGCSFLDFLNI